MKGKQKRYITADEGATISYVGNNQLSVISASDTTCMMQLDHDCARAATDISGVAELAHVRVTSLLESVTNVSCRGKTVMPSHQQEL